MFWFIILLVRLDFDLVSIFPMNETLLAITFSFKSSYSFLKELLPLFFRMEVSLPDYIRLAVDPVLNSDGLPLDSLLA
jgi:hypothetical protein